MNADLKEAIKTTMAEIEPSQGKKSTRLKEYI